VNRFKLNINIREHKHWLIADRKVLENTKLSPVARLVYYFLQGWNVNYQLSNNKLAEKLGVSESSVTRATKELKNMDLYYVNRVGAKAYSGYLGNTQTTASEFYEKSVEEKP